MRTSSKPLNTGSQKAGFRHRRARALALLAAAAVSLPLVATGCGSSGSAGQVANPAQPASGTSEPAGGHALPQGSDPVQLDPADFTTRIDNPYRPLKPGSRWVYHEVENGSQQVIRVTVTNDTKRVAAGITARVIRDTVHENGKLIEDTFDWYAQDKAGNVWYMGEATKSFDKGKVSTEGSWEAGVDGAQAGIIMPARPQAGMTYRQEHYAGHAEDYARVLGNDHKVEVPVGRFQGAVITEDLTPLEPNLVELKYHARGVGPVMIIDVSGASGQAKLVSFHKGR